MIAASDIHAFPKKRMTSRTSQRRLATANLLCQSEGEA